MILPFCMILLFLLRPKYNVFYSENLQNDRVRHYLRHGIFSKFYETFIFKIFELWKRKERSGFPGARAPFGFFSVCTSISIIFSILVHIKLCEPYIPIVCASLVQRKFAEYKQDFIFFTVFL
jgi:hypothetical protein